MCQVLLGLNPETRMQPVVDYLKRRGVPGEVDANYCLLAVEDFRFQRKGPARWLGWEMLGGRSANLNVIQ